MARSRLKPSADPDESVQQESRLAELEGIRARLREAIRLIPVEQ